MNLQLSKDEIPIFSEKRFYVPIHPRLLEEDVRIDKTLANKLFQQVASEWHEDLKEYICHKEDDPETLEWYTKSFLKNKSPKVMKDEFGVQSIDTIPHWEDFVLTDERGFARALSISRNSGGSLYFNREAAECRNYLPLDGKKGRQFSIPREKALEFNIGETEGYGEAFVYSPHNIDYYPGALFLRNWALAYINAAIASIS